MFTLAFIFLLPLYFSSHSHTTNLMSASPTNVTLDDLDRVNADEFDFGQH